MLLIIGAIIDEDVGLTRSSSISTLISPGSEIFFILILNAYIKKQCFIYYRDRLLFKKNYDFSPGYWSLTVFNLNYHLFHHGVTENCSTFFLLLIFTI